MTPSPGIEIVLLFVGLLVGVAALVVFIDADQERDSRLVIQFAGVVLVLVHVVLIKLSRTFDDGDAA